MGKVEFVSYNGKYPNLCSGTLVLKIDGKIEKFGHDCLSWSRITHSYRGEENDPHYAGFWSSGGSVWFSEDWDAHIDVGRWEIDIDEIPEQFKQYYKEIEEVFNDNVPYGCCGGCV